MFSVCTYPVLRVCTDRKLKVVVMLRDRPVLIR